MPEDFARHLVIVGVRDDDIPGVAKSVELMAECLAPLGYKQALPELANLQPGVDLKIRLANWASTVAKEDIAILYFAGHGGTIAGRHYLGLPGSDWLHPSATALPSEELFRVLAEGTQLLRLLVILDTCYSGQGALDALGLTNVLQGEEKDRAFLVVTASRPKQEAGDEDFAVAFRDCVSEKRGAALPGYEIPTLISDLKSRLKPSQTPGWVALGLMLGEAPDFLPNPNFLSAALVNRPIEDRHFFHDDLLQHWKPRAIGSEAIFQSGQWYFTGRTTALQELVAYLSAQTGTGRGLIVTGDPGSGKSAVLGYLTLASDPEEANQPAFEAFLATMPEGTRPALDSITFALALRGKTLAEALSALAERFSAKPDDVLGKLTTGNVNKVLVFDALDESMAPEDIADKLLRPLSGYPHVRIIVGTRRPQIKFLGQRFDPLDLDLPRYRSDADLAQYVSRILLAEGEPRATPYSGQPSAASNVAKAVAERANGNYLIARTVARSLMERDTVIDLTTEPLPQNMPDAFADSLRVMGERSGLGDWRVRESLLPLAYLKGQGVPLDIWELFTPTYVSQILSLAAAFIAEYVEEGRTVYRLYHQALADALHDPKLDAERQRKMAQALRDAVPEGNWLRAHWFTRKYFSLYAAAGSVELLEQAMLDVRFLAAANLPLLLTVSSAIHAAEAKRRLNWLKLASDRLTNGDEADRLSNLQLCALQSNAADLAAECKQANVRRKWQPKWARWARQVTPHRILRGHEGTVNSVAIAGGVIVSVSEDYTVRFWNAATGEPIGVPGQHDNKVAAVAANSGTAITGSWDDTVCFWDLNTGRAKGPRLIDHRNHVLAVAISGGIAASGDGDGMIILWDVKNARSISKPLSAHSRPVSAMALVDDVLVSGSEDGTLAIWSQTTRRKLKELSSPPLPTSTKAVTALAAANGIIYAVYGFRYLQSWSLATGLSLHTPIALEEMVNGIAIHDLSLACAGNDFKLRFIDPTTGLATSTPLIGHTLFATSVAVEKDILVSGAADNTVRVWDLESIEPFGNPEALEQLTCASVAISKAAAITISWTNRMSVWDLETGASRAPQNITTAPGENVPVAASDSVVAFNGTSEAISLLDLETSEVSPLPGYGGPAVSLAISDNKLVALCANHELRRWDLTDRKPIGRAKTLDDMPNAIAIAGRVVWTSGPSLQRWNLRTGEALGSSLDRNHGTSSLQIGGEWLVSSHWNGRLTVRDAQTGEVLRGTSQSPQSRVNCLALYKTFTVSGSPDGTVCIGNLTTMAPLLQIQLGSPVNGLAATPTGVCVACASGVISLELNL